MKIIPLSSQRDTDPYNNPKKRTEIQAESYVDSTKKENLIKKGNTRNAQSVLPVLISHVQLSDF